jgi:GT2 family glycosyltransferase
VAATGVEISIVIPSVSRQSSLERLLDSIELAKRQTPFDVEIIVVCSGYPEGVVGSLRADKVVQFEHMPRVSAARNAGAAAAAGRYLLFVDDDNVIAPDMLCALYSGMEQGNACVVAPVMYYLSQPERPWCVTVHRTRVLARTIFNRDPVPSSAGLLSSEDFPNCFMVCAADFLAVGGFDEQRFPQHFEESDLCRRLAIHTRRGIYCVAAARDWHDIAPEPMRELHLKSDYMAYQCARARALFLAMYGTNVQWYAFVAIGQWLFAAFYILAAIRGRGWRSAQPLVLSYLKGVVHGVKQGLHARIAT